jgi:hypothetical protein
MPARRRSCGLTRIGATAKDNGLKWALVFALAGAEQL